MEKEKMNPDEVSHAEDIALKAGMEFFGREILPLLGRNMPQKERVKKGFALLRDAGYNVDRQEIARMQAILYLLAGKFLTHEEMDEVKEEVAMTVLGQMLMADGIQKGIQKGIQQGIAGSILELLGELGDVPEALKGEILSQKDTVVLKGWFTAAAHAQSITEFEDKAGIQMITEV